MLGFSPLASAPLGDDGVILSQLVSVSITASSSVQASAVVTVNSSIEITASSSVQASAVVPVNSSIEITASSDTQASAVILFAAYCQIQPTSDAQVSAFSLFGADVVSIGTALVNVAAQRRTDASLQINAQSILVAEMRKKWEDALAEAEDWQPVVAPNGTWVPQAAHGETWSTIGSMAA